MNERNTSQAKTNPPKTADAYEVVLTDLRTRLTTGMTGDARAVVEQALAALQKVAKPAAAKPAAAATAASTPDGSVGGNPKPGSAAEVDAELALEKLDP